MSKMERIVAQMKERVSDFNPNEDDPDEQELLIAFIEFADAYNRFNNQKNIDNWKNAKDKQRMVLEIGKKTQLTPYMNYIWKNSPEFDDIHQDRWISSELDRLRAPAFERYNPYNYIKRREEEERRRREEEEEREEEYVRIKNEDKRNIEKYATPPAAGGSFKLSKKLKKHSKKHSKKSKKHSKHSKKHSKKSRKSKSRRHSNKSRRH